MRGHEVTIFTRGRMNPELFPEIERLRGDRDGGLGALAGRSWDAVIDISAYLPRLARASAEVLRVAVERYVFISTISVYPSSARSGSTRMIRLARWKMRRSRKSAVSLTGR